MATAGSSRVWAGVAAVLALVAVVGASTLIVFDGPGCMGKYTVLSCGSCEMIDRQGGYHFAYTGENALFYSSYDCSDSTPVATLTDSTWYCESFTYESVVFNCSDDAATTISSWDITARRQQQ